MEEIIPATTITLTDNNDKIRLRRRIKNMCVHQYNIEWVSICVHRSACERSSRDQNRDE